MVGKPPSEITRVVGRYTIFGEIASGGMASVHFGRLRGEVGFSRTVAIKQLHPHLANDADVVAMFLDEARLAARIHHPNVVSVIDVVGTDGQLFLVMEYVAGETLARLTRASIDSGNTLSPKVAVTIMVAALRGLDAAHNATNELGEPLNIVHRDVSPQNVLVGLDGNTRVLDFGIAKAAGRQQATRDGTLKGKLAYMAPEHFRGNVSRQTDVYAAAIVLWEALTGRRLFQAESDALLLTKVLGAHIEPPSKYMAREGLSEATVYELDRVVSRGLARDLAKRYASASDMATELEQCIGLIGDSEVAAWVKATAGAAIEYRASVVQAIESQLAVDSQQIAVATTAVTDDDNPTVRTPTRRAALSRMVALVVTLLGGALLAFEAGVHRQAPAPFASQAPAATLMAPLVPTPGVALPQSEPSAAPGAHESFPSPPQRQPAAVGSPARKASKSSTPVARIPTYL